MARITPELLDRGAALASELAEADKNQEVARLKTLPENVRKMYELKGLVYLAVKQLNLLGRSVHAEDGGRASRYNMDILYRRTRKLPVDTDPKPA